MKFVLDGEHFGVPMSFFSSAAAADHPLACSLFRIGGVTSVLLLGDFVTINKSSSARWADITKAVKKVLKAAV